MVVVGRSYSNNNKVFCNAHNDVSYHMQLLQYRFHNHISFYSLHVFQNSPIEYMIVIETLAYKEITEAFA